MCFIDVLRYDESCINVFDLWENEWMNEKGSQAESIFLVAWGIS
jgi:hypothetical protein